MTSLKAFNRTARTYAMTRTSGGRTEEYWFSSDLELVRRDVDGRTVLAVSQDGRSHTLTDASGLKTIRNTTNGTT